MTCALFIVRHCIGKWWKRKKSFEKKTLTECVFMWTSLFYTHIVLVVLLCCHISIHSIDSIFKQMVHFCCFQYWHCAFVYSFSKILCIFYQCYEFPAILWCCWFGDLISVKKPAAAIPKYSPLGSPRPGLTLETFFS